MREILRKREYAYENKKESGRGGDLRRQQGCKEIVADNGGKNDSKKDRTTQR